MKINKSMMQYMEKELMKDIAELEANPNMKTYTEEEVHADMLRRIADWEANRELKRCIS
jgi:hypothetical protein